MVVTGTVVVVTGTVVVVTGMVVVVTGTVVVVTGTVVVVTGTVVVVTGTVVVVTGTVVVVGAAPSFGFAYARRFGDPAPALVTTPVVAAPMIAEFTVAGDAPGLPWR